MMKKAGSDSTIMEYRLHLVLTSKELEETAEKYHFSGMDVRTGMEELQGIHEMLCKAADCRTVCMVEKEKREAAARSYAGCGSGCASGGISEAGAFDGSLSDGPVCAGSFSAREAGHWMNVFGSG